MLRTILLFVVWSALVCSCRKKGSSDTPTPIDSIATPVYPNYMAMKPGNYWVYQLFQLDSANGSATAENQFDSCYVEKDTVINGKTFHKYMAATFGESEHHARYFRDSLSYVVTEKGVVVFSSDDFANVFRTVQYTNPVAGITDTIPITERMDYKNRLVTVPSGVFTTSTFRQIYYMPAPKYNYGPYRSYEHSYAENVGLVSETIGWYLLASNVFEHRLVRYHVQ